MPCALSQNMRLIHLALLATLLTSTACSGIAANIAANALGGEGSAFSSDDDPELVRDAIPFGLKTLESLLQSAPDNENLLLALSSGFTQYAYAFVQQEGQLIEDEQPELARQKIGRAKRLYARAREYGLRGLESSHEGFREEFAKDRAKALEEVDDEEDDVPLLYWTAAAWAAEISLSKDDMNMLGQLKGVEALMGRALELSPDYGDGAIREFYITYDTRSESLGGSLVRAKQHYDRVLELTGGKKIGPLVTWAESVCVPQQDREQFDKLLDQVLAFDANEAPRFRLVNLIAQQRARWLKARADDLFL